MKRGIHSKQQVERADEFRTQSSTAVYNSQRCDDFSSRASLYC